MSLPRVPFKQALVRVTLWLGCDPISLMWLACLSALIGIGGGLAFRELMLAPLGLFLFWLGHKGLIAAAKRDPQHPWIYFRAATYDDVYEARSRWDIPELPSRKWL